MTHRRLAALLALPILALPAVPASADGAGAAATTSFRLVDGTQVQEVGLVVVREDDQDLLLVRTSACGDDSCAGREQLVRLQEGQLALTDGTARLRVELGGRDLQVTWSLAGGGVQLSGARVRSDGRSGQTTADGFVGRTAEVQIGLDGARCTSTGAIGTAFRAATQEHLGDAALSAGELGCPAA